MNNATELLSEVDKAAKTYGYGHRRIGCYDVTARLKAQTRHGRRVESLYYELDGRRVARADVLQAIAE